MIAKLFCDIVLYRYRANKISNIIILSYILNSSLAIVVARFYVGWHICWFAENIQPWLPKVINIFLHFKWKKIVGGYLKKFYEFVWNDPIIWSLLLERSQAYQATLLSHRFYARYSDYSCVCWYGFICFRFHSQVFLIFKVYFFIIGRISYSENWVILHLKIKLALIWGLNIFFQFFFEKPFWAHRDSSFKKFVLPTLVIRKSEYWKWGWYHYSGSLNHRSSLFTIY